ncbi:MAG: hypothetical protein Q4D62_03865 [Planctomycetia bacterium]|nr:hypothetical protein [Planctomycetia bacterium]
MVVEREIPEFLAWLPGAIGMWSLSVGILLAVAFFMGMLWTGLRVGPRNAFWRMWHLFKQTFVDIFSVSPKRVTALALLTFKEAIRRKIVIGFIVFILIVLFAGMFLDPTSRHPAQLYIRFIFSATNYLTLLLVLLLTAFSLPGDIQRKTIHTIVTKPVKISEIVLGRVLGFVLMGTILLVAMGVVSYGFVVRSQTHTHTLLLEDLQTIPGNYEEGVQPAKEGKTSLSREHRHDVFLEPGGKVAHLEPRNDHTHQVQVQTMPDGQTRYIVGPPVEMFTARVPLYGRLRFRDVMGLEATKGVNVGDEWEYRSFIAGRSKAAFIWLFEGITPEKFPDGLPLEMTLEVFRTYKGKIDRRILGSILIRNPETGLMLEQQVFESVENGTAHYFIPRKIRAMSRATVTPVLSTNPRDGKVVAYPPEEKRDFGGEGKSEFDLFEDFVAPGSVTYIDGVERPMKNTLEIWVRCLEPGQYFGAANSDLYIRSQDAPFAWNFFKGYAGIWLQMVLVVVYGVLFSTFLSTPVALLATLFVMLGGFFHPFLMSLGTGTILGGGPFEAAIRVFTQENLTIELDMNAVEIIIAGMFDSVFQGFIWLLAHLLPMLENYDASNFVAGGFNIPLRLVMMNFLSVLGFVFPVYIVSYLFLKTREMER